MDYGKRYFGKLANVFAEVIITDLDRRRMFLDNAINEIIIILREIKNSDNKVIFIGNGGSAAIASHQAVDYWKNGGIPAIAFNDSSLLTCISNDYGYEFVFQKPIEMFAKKDDVLVAISSSGASKNILNGVKSARSRELKVITMSGFSDSNPLCVMGDYNFYVPSKSYGHVEITHLALCHTILDAHMNSDF